MSSVAAIVLAAGASRRLGQPKQFLKIEGMGLLRRVVTTVHASRCAEIFVVVGSHDQRVCTELHGFGVTVVTNPVAAEGMGSSIRAGIRALRAASASFNGALILVTDQLKVTVDLLNMMIDQFESRKGDVIACEYAGLIGVPALFASRHFDQLETLSDDRGARRWLRSNECAVVRIPFPEGTLDIDTCDDIPHEVGV